MMYHIQHLTYDEAVEKAKTEATRWRCNFIVFRGPDGTFSYCPGSYAKPADDFIATLRVKPAYGQWNGSRLVETQSVENIL